MKLLTFLFFTFSALTSFSQIEFENGYYIDNNGNKIEGLIKNVDWDKNPTDFHFQQAGGTSDGQRVTIDQAKEFGIDNVSKYIRATVDIDRSSEKIEKLSVVRTPDFKKEQLFLKVLVEGKASLYGYADGEVERFFYETVDVPLQQLVYKSYRYQDVINKNNTYREQLKASFKCGKPAVNAIGQVAYSRNALTRLFLQHNECIQAEVVDFVSKKKYDFFNLWLRPRVTFSSLSAARNGVVVGNNFEFDDKVNFSGGIEAEFVLPFNRNKWAIMIEPTYQAYKASIPSEPITVDYQALELPLGLRHYFFLNEKSKLSLGFAFQLTFPFNSTVTHMSSVELEITKSSNMAFEVGYVFNNRFCAAFRLQTKRELLGKYTIWESEFNTMAIVLGYSPF